MWLGGYMIEQIVLRFLQAIVFPVLGLDLICNKAKYDVQDFVDWQMRERVQTVLGEFFLMAELVLYDLICQTVQDVQYMLDETGYEKKLWIFVEIYILC